jgi:hypothetical protein
MADNEHCPEHAWKGPNLVCYSNCGCRCEGCRRANRDRFRAERNNPGNNLASAGKARRCLEDAHGRGYSDRQIAAATGVSVQRVGAVRKGRQSHVTRRTGRAIVRGVEQLVAQVTPDYADGIVVRAMIVWLRDHGASDRWIAGQMGTHKAHVSELRRGDRVWVYRSTEERARRLRNEVLAERIIPPGHAPNAHVQSSQRTHGAQKQARYERERRRRQRGGTQ